MDFSLDDIEFDDIKDISEEKTTGNKKDKKQKKSVEKKKKTFLSFRQLDILDLDMIK